MIILKKYWAAIHSPFTPRGWPRKHIVNIPHVIRVELISLYQLLTLGIAESFGRCIYVTLRVVFGQHQCFHICTSGLLVGMPHRRKCLNFFSRSSARDHRGPRVAEGGSYVPGGVYLRLTSSCRDSGTNGLACLAVWKMTTVNAPIMTYTCM